jgi:glycosyltransferase involved in cell wall biosynthesis
MPTGYMAMTTATTEPRAAVIIPHFNDTARLQRCLAALTAQDLSSVDVVVVDNGSTQPLDDIRTAYPQVRFLVEPMAGAAMARNCGVRESAAPLLFFLDADCVPAPDWLEVALRVAGQGDLVGGRVDVFDETPPPRSGAEAYEAVFAFRCKWYVERRGFSVTANLLTRRDVFEAVGGFRSGLSEDKDWCRRAGALGYRLVYEDRLQVRHPSRGDWAALAGKWRRLTREAFALSGAGRGQWALFGLGQVAIAMKDLPRIVVAAELSGLRERGAAALALIRLRCLKCWWMLRQAAGAKI